MSPRLKTLSPAYQARQLALAVSAIDLKRDIPIAWRAVRVDVAIMVALTALAALPRLFGLTEIPPGFHGDEGWTGLDARRVLDEGWIGVYVGSARGQPAGPLYFTAPFVWLFGDTVFAVRFAMAAIAVITIPVAHLTFRVMFGRTVGVFAAIFLALGLWHIHYSRIGFMVIAWPLMELLTLLFLFLGLKSGRWIFYVVGGLFFGAGVYSYNAYPIFAIPVAAFMTWLAGREVIAWLRKQRTTQEVLALGAKLVLFLIVALIATVPMMRYASDPAHGYLNHHRDLSVLESPEWEEATFAEQVDIMWDRTENYFISVYWDGEPDGIDASGAEAMVDRLTLALIVIGVVLMLVRWRNPASVFVLLALLLLPIASITTIDSMMRRSVGLVPFVAVLAAFPVALWWDRATSLGSLGRNSSYAAIAAIVVLVGYQNLDYYFRDFGDSELARFTFAVELADASEYMADLPDGTYVYLYSGRWGYQYETRLYLASDVPGEDRSNEFGTFSLTPTQPGPVAYVFLEPYLAQADEVARLYPGGELTEGVDGSVTNFRAYYLPSTEGIAEPPPEVTPDPSEPTATPEANAAERDAQRQQDFAVIAQALEQYRQEKGAYPDTGNQVQSLCVFPDDVGCDLEDVLDPIPPDPLGDPGANGYWYAGTADEYHIYGRRETDAFPLCPDHPDHLGDIDALLCLSGP